jgi:hypothetical protein
MSRTIAWLASFATILGISIANAVEFWQKSSPWRQMLLVLAIGGAIIWAIADLLLWFRRRPQRYKTEAQINSYMRKLLARGGTAYIFANNLTWVDEGVSNFIETHAARKIIRIYVPKENQITARLRNYGAQVVIYSRLGYIPEARFTLLNPDEPGSSILAVGKGAVPNFFIDEFTDAEHARFISIARDLFAILDKVGDEA